MKALINNKKLKLVAGLIIFSAIVVAIVCAFLFSVLLFLNIVLDYIVLVGSWPSPFVVLGLLFVIFVVYGRRRYKLLFLPLMIAFMSLGMLDVAKIIFPSFDIRNPTSSLLRTSIKHASSEDPIRVYKGDIKVFYQDQDSYFVKSDILGYAPAKNRKTKTYATYLGEKLFDVHYTINENGQRISPPFSFNPNAYSILFFGCAPTFGYGLKDHETMPYMVGHKTNGMCKIYNFGFNGYGTHQMVSALEHNLVDSIVEVPPRYIFYTAIPAHIDRIKNNKDWGLHDPRYILNERREAIYQGHFDEYENAFLRKFLYTLKNSYAKLTYRSYVLQLLQKDEYEREYSIEDEDLFIALIKKARNLAQEKYPNAEFHVIYWPMNMKTERRIVQLLNYDNFNLHLITDVIPDYESNFKNYWIKYPIEPHPNVLANEQISDYIVTNVIDNQ